MNKDGIIENKIIWIIRKHSINSNDITRPELATIIGESPGWAFNLHVKVKLKSNSKIISLPIERCFETLREAVDYVDDVYHQQCCSYATMTNRYEASKRKTEKLKIMINDLMSNENYI